MEEHVPFLSVIVPAHNSEAWIRKGLDSIREQNFDDYELIVVCDACTDRTAEVAREYTDKVIEVEFGRDGLARNAGIDAAKGTWLLFMDDDDWFLHEYAFAILANRLLMMGDIDVLAFDFIWKHKGYASQAERCFIAVWCKAWKREFIEDTRFPDTPYWSDVEFNDAIGKKEPRLSHWPMPLYYYNYLREGSISWRQMHGEIE